MASKIVTGSYRKNAADVFTASIDSSRYYFFASKFEPFADPDSDIASDSVDYTDEIYRQMVFGKKLTSDDVFSVARRIDWEANTVYDQYDSNTAVLSMGDYYVSVNAGAYYHVYKCLYNNRDTRSTVQPDFDMVSPGDRYFETSDGYMWKYLYSVTDDIVDAFATEDYFPVTSNTTVVSEASEGSIDIISVDGRGSDYDNYVAGNNYFSTTQLRLGGNSLLFDISSNTSTSSANDFYNDCIIYIKSGPANEVGQYKKIVDYTVNSTSKAIVLESAFTNAISIAACYEIYPSIGFTSDFSETEEAVAYAVVNSVGNTIHKVDVIYPGAGYRSVTAEVMAYVGVGATNAELRIIASPPGGHGSDPVSEIGASTVMLRMEYDGGESNTIPSGNDYRSVGLLVDPLFDGMTITVSSLTGSFLNGEEVLGVSWKRLGTNASANSAQTTITDVGGDFQNQFSIGSNILLISGNNTMYSTVASVTNSSSLTLTSNSSFSANSISYYDPTTIGSGIVSTSNSTTVTLDSVDVSFDTGTTLVGIDSGARATSGTTTIGGVTKGLETFVGTYKYVGNTVSGTFQEDETVYQNSLSTNGVLHSVEGGFFYTSGIFSNGTIVGANSGAVATLTNGYTPEIVYRSGKVLYIENVDPIPRDPGQKETFRIAFSF